MLLLTAYWLLANITMENTERARKIDILANLYAPSDKFKSRYKKPTIYALVLVLLSIAVFFTDYYLLPHQKTEDAIVRYQKITDQNYNLLGYKYFTQEGFGFYISGGFIKEYNVTIERTIFFKKIKKVITEKEEYSDGLISDHKRVNFYFIIVLAVSSVISLLYLCFYKDLSDNGFFNIVLFNSLMIIYILFFSSLSG